MSKYIKLFDKPKIIGIIGDTNSGKSNLIHAILQDLSKENKFHLFTYGFRVQPDNPGITIYSVEELELIKNSIIIIDEVMSLFDLDNRKSKKSIENTLRLIHHNNNVLIMCLLPENTKKFLSGKINIHIFKQCTIADFINGSRTKNILNGYHGIERGSRILNLPPNRALLYDNEHYHSLHVPYIETKDLKKKNKKIVNENVSKNVLISCKKRS